jgi:hypothetical protein
MIMEHTGDYNHQCNSKDNALDQEDIGVVGDYTEDGTTTNTVSHPWNKIQPEEDDKTYTDRGNNALSYRQRQHYEYIEDPTKNERAKN